MRDGLMDCVEEKSRERTFVAEHETDILNGLLIVSVLPRSDERVFPFSFSFLTRQVTFVAEHETDILNGLLMVRMKGFFLFPFPFLLAKLYLVFIRLLAEHETNILNGLLMVSVLPLGYPRDAPATVLFGEWFRFEKMSDQYPHNDALTTYFRSMFSSVGSCLASERRKRVSCLFAFNTFTSVSVSVADVALCMEQKVLTSLRNS
ncbi:hypothetical protein LXL04_003635 [Taraxacum kok-saghyz]